LKFNHRVAHRFEHAPHQPIATLAYRHAHVRIRLHLLNGRHFRLGPTIFQPNTRSHFFKLIIRQNALNLGRIGSRHLKLGVQEFLGKVAIIRQEEQPFGVVIQSTHGIQAPAA
jgi:hypothetical protein